MDSSKANPFTLHFDDIESSREVLITVDGATCYRKLGHLVTVHSDERVVGQVCYFNETEVLICKPEQLSCEWAERFPCTDEVSAIVYRVRAVRDGQEFYLGDTESHTHAWAVIQRLIDETAVYERAVDVSTLNLPKDEWNTLQDLVKHVDTCDAYFECFELPRLGAIGIRLYAGSWTVDQLQSLALSGIEELQAIHRRLGFPEQFIRTLNLAGQAGVKMLTFSPKARCYPGLPVY